jgi:hypothetical protein
MIVSPGTEHATSIAGIELALTLIAVATAFAWPRIGSSCFSHLERVFKQLARRRGLAVAFVGLLAVLLRIAILPFCPIPLPFVPDDFSFLLAADTFAHGRLTNPTPAMWTHFESIHITMQPTYMSMYFPAHGMILAAGTLLFGHPWYGLLIASALMCASICWMLQAWMPPSWAFLGGVIAVVHLGLFSYWTNTYHAAGSIAALGGALILGGLPRLMKRPSLRYSLLMAIGVVILGLSRPYECALLCLPVAVVLGRWLSSSSTRPSAKAMFRLTAAPALLVLAGVTWMGYYDYRAFGSPTTLPYTVSRNTYAMAPYFIWQSPRPEPAYRNEAMRVYYSFAELEFYSHFHTEVGFFIIANLAKIAIPLLFFAGISLLPPIFMFRRVLLDRRIRFLHVSVFVLAAGMVVEIFLLPHYLAPFTAAFYAIGLQAMRHLRVWTNRGQPVGLAMLRLTITVCIVIAGMRLYAGPLHLPLPEWPSTWDFNWYGPDHFGTERVRVKTVLEQFAGKQLVIVRYSSRHNPYEEWVYNAADIDDSKVVWAREMDMPNNLELIHYYKDRKVWLVEPDHQPATMSPYPIPGQPAVAQHGPLASP